jgi:hypothetical protein
MDRQNGPTAEQISWSKPLKEKLPALFGDDETPSEAFRQQEKLVGRVTLICRHSVSAKSALGCSSQDRLALERSQSIEKLWLQIRAFDINP